MVRVNTDAIDRDWSKDGADYYIPRGGGGPEIPGRSANFRDFLKTGEPVIAPKVSYDPKSGAVSFENGRHRFAVLRDQGERQISVSVPKDQVRLFVRKYRQGPEVPPPHP